MRKLYLILLLMTSCVGNGSAEKHDFITPYTCPQPILYSKEKVKFTKIVIHTIQKAIDGCALRFNQCTRLIIIRDGDYKIRCGRYID